MTLCHLPLSILSNFRPLFTFTLNNKILSNKNPNKILSFNKLNNKKNENKQRSSGKKNTGKRAIKTKSIASVSRDRHQIFMSSGTYFHVIGITSTCILEYNRMKNSITGQK